MSLRKICFAVAAALVAACGARHHEPTLASPQREQTAQGTVGEDSELGATGGTGMQDQNPARAGTTQSGPSTEPAKPQTPTRPQTQRPDPDPNDPYYPNPNPNPDPSPNPNPNPTPNPTPYPNPTPGGIH